MKALAESEGDVFLPNTEPEGPVQYVLICMEPSLGRWARSADEARSKVEAGFRNFLFSMEDFILHFCARLYLCKPKERYHITDLSKGAMLVKRAVSDVNYFFPSATIIIPGSPLPSKPAPYPKRVKRREPVGRPEVHPPAAVSPPAFRPVLCV